ncbi:MAG: histidine kinase [Bacteroidetes bacterium]|nr:histidine kinase [Bacteroidota bacterium]
MWYHYSMKNRIYSLPPQVIQWLVYAAGVVLLFLMSVTSSWVYYLGTDHDFQWEKHLLTRFPSYGLWLVLIPVIFTLIRNRISRHGLSVTAVLQLAGAGLVLALIHRPAASFLSALVTGTTSQFFLDITSATAFQILAYVLDSYLVFLLITGARLTETAWKLTSAVREQALQLERNLADSRLQTLSIQFQPHFIFNALQGLSMLIYKDPASADTMITTLSDLLRASARMAETPRIPLGEELELAEKYLSIQQIRFGTRLSVTSETEPGCLTLLCPPFMLQPLFENAIKHAVERNPDQTRISLRIYREKGQLILQMANTLPSIPPDAREGTGLGLIRERLALLYPGTASLSHHQTDSLFLVEIRLPVLKGPGA